MRCSVSGLGLISGKVREEQLPFHKMGVSHQSTIRGARLEVKGEGSFQVLLVLGALLEVTWMSVKEPQELARNYLPGSSSLGLLGKMI